MIQSILNLLFSEEQEETPLVRPLPRWRTEQRILQKYFPSMTFQHLTSGPNPGILGKLRSNSGKAYQLWVPVRSFPCQPPPVYLLDKDLKNYRGHRLASMGASHAMHLLGPDDHGHARICHIHPERWHERITLYHVLVKVRVWLEAYEAHLRTGKPLDHYVPS